MTATGPHIVIDISYHGFGHTAQVAALVPALRRRLPGMRLTVRTGVPETVLRDTIPGAFELSPGPADPGLRMFGPDRVDAEASARAYADLHARWDAVVSHESRRLRELGADLLIADIPYTSLAASAEAGVPAAAFCSLNWSDLFAAYRDGADGPAQGGTHIHGQIHAQIRDAYRTAAVFLQPVPHMPMEDLPNRRSISPLARLGADRRDHIRRRCGARPGDRFVLVTWGGISGDLGARASGDWPPHLHGVWWIVGDGLRIERDDVRAVGALGLPFVDAIRSCDAVITKTGYGTFTESVFNGTRVLFAPRPDWPESPYLETWLLERGTAVAVNRDALRAGDIGGPLGDLLDRPVTTPAPPAGAVEAAEILASL
jgi:hypothetical protein